MSHSTKQKKKHLKAVQPKLRVFRAKEPLLSVFMWGINHSINELNHVNIPVMLMPDDFKSHSKVRVDNHLFNKDNMPSHFKVKEYCPLVFRNLRERFDIDEDTYGNSLTKFCPYDCDSSGRSGARFLHSWDKKFVVKTILSEEVAEMHRIIKDYHQHIVERHSETLLPQYMGMYRVTVNDSETYLLVMRHIFSPRLNIHRKYDLKGSTVDRQASEKEKSKDLPTFKDNDFVNDGMDIHIGADAKDKLMATLNADIDFLCKQNLMDYSLLVGIHDVDRAEQELNESGDDEENGCEEEEDEEEAEGGGSPPDSPAAYLVSQPSFTGEIDPGIERFGIKSSEESGHHEVYFLALVDILTHYGMKKRTAQAAKTVKHGAGAEISTVKPDQYARRFLDFVARIFS
ncbi:hypothetical protein CAPTEDRAFT_144687 [Capitella teleta]|uniref:1-phosphatidylinositol-5-phosphate 4-kinase n=1 Tax=Capitella teleta TaxID=283909 RepID=R7URJ8_CAPTE|nr:hypothetical protein CAPTEDRAFT_144687 [Capitella teleta]|eukprot:ELU08768.1 hypothetical protein CAPTEDRAFT_144687 [Capitella teleta]